MLSSTGGVAKYRGYKLGEFVETENHERRPYFEQRDTENNVDNFLYSEGGNWFVSDTLGECHMSIV